MQKQNMLTKPDFYTTDKSAVLYQADTFAIMEEMVEAFPQGKFDMIFADPPYFLSNGGFTCHAGEMVSVDKGKWDKSGTPQENHAFNKRWLSLCQKLLKPNGTIWITGTHHVIHSIGFALQELEFKFLNDIAWEKPNPPPNLSCRFFTHSTETVLWAAKTPKSKHVFNYQTMRQMNDGKQMKTVWKIKPPATAEKIFGKHPTQKPLELLERCILAGSNEGDLIFDPFLGGGTTAVAALRNKRHCVGVEMDEQHFSLAKKRVEEQFYSDTKMLKAAE